MTARDDYPTLARIERHGTTDGHTPKTVDELGRLLDELDELRRLIDGAIGNLFGGTR